MEDNEVWVEMWDYPAYEISNKGNVRNAKTGKSLAVRQIGRDYRNVSIYANGKTHTKRIGRYVWMSFNRQFCSKTIDHQNQNAGDDRLENLRCVDMQTNYENRSYSNYKNKYELTNKDRGYIHYSISNGYETTWTIMLKYHIPMNYLQTTMKRQSWLKYVSLLDEVDIKQMKERKLLYDFNKL